MTFYYLDPEEVIALNRLVVEKSGGSSGLRDAGMLEAIISKPQASFGGEELYPDLFLKAAVLFEATVNYHVFIDGNKRTAFISMATFLKNNNYELEVSDQEIEDFCVNTATNNPDLAEVAIWIKQHCRKN